MDEKPSPTHTRKGVKWRLKGHENNWQLNLITGFLLVFPNKALQITYVTFCPVRRVAFTTSSSVSSMTVDAVLFLRPIFIPARLVAEASFVQAFHSSDCYCAWKQKQGYHRSNEHCQVEPRHAMSKHSLTINAAIELLSELCSPSKVAGETTQLLWFLIFGVQLKIWGSYAPVCNCRIIPDIPHIHSYIHTHTHAHTHTHTHPSITLKWCCAETYHLELKIKPLQELSFVHNLMNNERILSTAT